MDDTGIEPVTSSVSGKRSRPDGLSGSWRPSALLALTCGHWERILIIRLSRWIALVPFVCLDVNRLLHCSWSGALRPQSPHARCVTIWRRAEGREFRHRRSRWNVALSCEFSLRSERLRAKLGWLCGWSERGPRYSRQTYAELCKFSWRALMCLDWRWLRRGRGHRDQSGHWRMTCSHGFRQHKHRVYGS